MKDILDLQLESEITKQDKIKKIQEEVDNLNKSLNACIDLVSESVGNDHTLENLRRLKEETTASYARVTNEIDEVLEKGRDNITQIKLEQKAKEEIEEEMSEENKKGSEA